MGGPAGILGKSGNRWEAWSREEGLGSKYQMGKGAIDRQGKETTLSSIFNVLGFLEVLTLIGGGESS